MRTTATSTLDSAANALRLMRLIGARGSITLADAAAQLGVSKSTAHRLLMTLLAQDYTTRDPAGRRYYAGQNAVSAGLSTLWDFDVRQRTSVPLLQLAESTGETVKLLVLDGPYARVLDVAETRRSLHIGSSLGKLLPANATAGGKMLLSAHSEDSLRERFAGRLPTLTDNTIDNWDYLSVELQAIRNRGWALSRGESTPHVNGIAVPVVGRGGWIMGALAVAAPEERLIRSRHLEILGQLMHVARQLGRAMGGTAARLEATSAPASIGRRAG